MKVGDKIPANFVAAVRRLYPDASFASDVVLYDPADGTGAVLAAWRIPDKQPPTVDEIAAALALPPIVIVSPLEFRRLFTQAERIAITQAGYTDAQVRVFLDDAAAADEINLSHDEVTTGVAYLQATGLVTADRAAAVLAGTPPT